MNEWFEWHWKTIAWGVGLIALAAGYAYIKKPPGQGFETKSATVRSFCMDIADRDFNLKLDPDKGEAVPFGKRAKYVSNYGIVMLWENRAGMPAIKCSATFVQAKPRIVLFEVDGVNMTGLIR